MLGEVVTARPVVVMRGLPSSANFLTSSAGNPVVIEPAQLEGYLSVVMLSNLVSRNGAKETGAKLFYRIYAEKTL